MLREIIEPNLPTTASDIEAFSIRHGVALPTSYVAFLLKNNGGQPIPTAFPIADFPNDPAGTIQVFFGFRATFATSDIERVLADLQDAIPARVVPIACTDGYDFVCLNLRKPGGPVVFWDRRPFWGNNVWNENDLYGVASDFEALLLSLHELKST